MKAIPATTANQDFNRYLDMAQTEPVVVTQNNRPVAITISIEDAREFIDYKVAHGIKSGLQDIEEGRTNELTPDYAKSMKKRFQSQTK